MESVFAYFYISACMRHMTHCLSSWRPCFQLSWLLAGSGRASFSVPSSKGQRSHTGRHMPVNHSISAQESLELPV